MKLWFLGKTPCLEANNTIEFCSDITPDMPTLFPGDIGVLHLFLVPGWYRHIPLFLSPVNSSQSPFFGGRLKYLFYIVQWVELDNSRGLFHLSDSSITHLLVQWTWQTYSRASFGFVSLIAFISPRSWCCSVLQKQLLYICVVSAFGQGASCITF